MIFNIAVFFKMKQMIQRIFLFLKKNLMKAKAKSLHYFQ
ncbi:hypothetical protein RU99_GL000184 [Enterococcus casseliflavus]|nr:hypothetical protein RU99_GL000184 [Enterococcus casseliflavus]